MPKYSSVLSRSQLSLNILSRARRSKARSFFDQIIESLLFPDVLYQPGDAGFTLPNTYSRTKSGRPRRRRRIDYSRSEKAPKNDNPWDTVPWLRALRNERVNDPKTREGKEFRRKFRVPFPVFEKIVTMCRETDEPEFNVSDRLIGGKPSIPLELKILSVLRILAGGLTFKDGAELTCFMSEGTCGRFFKRFCHLFTQHFQQIYIRPQSGDDLKRTMETYAKLGLPGCVGSIDATFVGPWDACAHNLKNVCSGDKGKGFLYEVIVNHSKLVVSVEGGYWGTGKTFRD
jgi:hypothetical protein